MLPAFEYLSSEATIYRLAQICFHQSKRGLDQVPILARFSDFLGGNNFASQSKVIAKEPMERKSGRGRGRPLAGQIKVSSSIFAPKSTARVDLWCGKGRNHPEPKQS